MMPTCPFDHVDMTLKKSGQRSLSGFEYELFECGVCRFEHKQLAVPLEMVYQEVYDEGDYIGFQLLETSIEPKRAYLKDFINQHCPKGSTLLEIGPGNGRNLLYAKALGYRVATLDIAESNNRYYRDTCKFDYIYHSLEDIPTASVDAVIMTHVIEHVQEPAEMMAGVQRVLKPGGKILISTPSTASLLRKALGYTWWIYDIDDHVSFFNLANLRTLLKQSAFRPIDVRSRNTDAAHAIMAILRKIKNGTVTKTDQEATPQTRNNAIRTLKIVLDRCCALSAYLGLGYEAVCIAEKIS